MKLYLEAYSETCQTCTMEHIAKMVNGFKLFIILQNAPYSMFESVLNKSLILMYTLTSGTFLGTSGIFYYLGGYQDQQSHYFKDSSQNLGITN